MSVWETFRGHAERRPDRPAIRSDDGVITYGDLREQVEDLASRLSAALPPGSLLALGATGPTMGLTAYLATSLAGRALLPLNSQSPPLHRAAVLADARPAAILTEAGLEPLPGEPAGGFDEIAYVLYTSGTTGPPKGVLIPRQALTDRLAGLATVVGLSAEQSMLAMTGLSFDISIVEMLLPLMVGGTVVAAPEGCRLDPVLFADVVARHRPNVLQATPSFWRLALASGWAGAPGSDIWCGGEHLTGALAAELLPRCRRLWNLYGPTEATIYATGGPVLDAEVITLGDPMPGTGIWLDPSGEILLYGDGLASGYLNRPELTAERFRFADTGVGKQLCYFTGDRGHRRADGTIEFLGRLDTQVKFRGHRVELGEIERTLETHPAISEAVAVVGAADDPRRAHIAAFVVARVDVPVRELRAWLAERLLPPARPARIEVVDALPRTAAGKIDRRILVERR